MSGHGSEPTTAFDEDELKPTETAGYKVGQKKTLEQYNQLDAEDDSLQRWKATLGLGTAANGSGPGGAGTTTTSSGPKVEMLSLSLVSDSRPQGPLVLDLTADLGQLKEATKKNPLIIKEGADYAVELKFRINGDLVTGLRYIQVVKRAGVKLDKLESMIGSYGPNPEPISKRFVTEEAPSGLLARSGSNAVRSRVIDDDGTVFIDFEWSFKIAKEW